MFWLDPSLGPLIVFCYGSAFLLARVWFLHSKNANFLEILLPPSNPTPSSVFSHWCICVSNFSHVQGGIIFWLRGSLRDVPDISPEIAFIKSEYNDKKCIILSFF